MNFDIFKHGVKLMSTEEMPEIFRRYQRATKFGGKKMGNFRAKMSNNPQNMRHLRGIELSA